MEKGKRLRTVNGETPLPEAMIQHIQSFLTGKEAAQTTLLSKSWYDAWSTRPTLDFDESDFKNRESPEVGFAEFATKSMQRYQDLNLKIESFRLRTVSCRKGVDLLANKLIADAVEMGAADLSLELRSAKFISLRELVGSRLKSLTLDRVHMKSDGTIRDIISCCISIEDLSLSKCTCSIDSKSRKIELNRMNLYELRKLRRLFLEMVYVDTLFFTDFDSRFPRLKDLSVVRCLGYKTIQIASTSLERISFVQFMGKLRGEFDVPNLVDFSCSGVGIPSVSVASSWDCSSSSYISIIHSRPDHARSWFMRLKTLFAELSPSKISLSINTYAFWHLKRNSDEEGGNVVEAMLKPDIVLEDVAIKARCGLDALLVGLFAICRPKLITLLPLPSEEYWRRNDESIDFLCKKLMKEINGPNCGIPDESMFGQFDLKEVNVEVYHEILTEWQPLLLKEPLDLDALSKQKIRFQLRWG
ncbi:hypothetical protein C2S52_014610 [Perilla frutescens var. hirtella]|nr:hypothetical protein C2S52_014610 [Perilla frutescens var. hirtella]